MDRVIMKRSDNLNLVNPEAPTDDIDGDYSINKQLKKKRKRFRNEPDGVMEVLIDGQGDYRNTNKGMGTDQSFESPFNVTPGWA